MPYTTNGIASVYQRGQGAQNFEQYYESLCALQDTVPLLSIKSHLAEHRLEVNADKIRLPDWGPILKSIKINKSLRHISIRSRYDGVDSTLATESQSASKGLGSTRKTKVPCIHSRDLTFQLCKALKDCLIATDNLCSLSVEGLPLRTRDLIALSKGIANTGGLHELSLARSRFGEGLNIICQGLKDACSINILNLSGCGLAEGAVECITKVVKHQSIMRHSEAWKSSLRYRIPDLDCMPGLRRITLNHNPLLGDTAALAFADALKDDLWLKAIDMQECGITNAGAQALLDSLRLNSTLLILDIRRNHLIDRALIQKLMHQIMINNDGKSTQYDWLPTTPPVPKPPRSFVQRGSSAIKTPASASRKRCSSSPMLTPRTVPRLKGMPWRTAERAAHYKHAPTCPESSNSYTPTTDLLADSDSETSSFSNDIRPLEEVDEDMNEQIHSTVKELQAENISLKRRLSLECKSRVAAEDRALELARENRRLVAEIRRHSLVAATSQQGTGVDEELLSQVESAFSKFNQFIDLVRDSGLGHLVNEAGLGGLNPGHPGYIPNTSLDTSYMEMQRANQSDDIIRHTEATDSPKKYSDYFTSCSPLEKHQNSSSKNKSERKRRHREHVKISERHSLAEKKAVPASKSLKFNELKDISELETPKDTPRQITAIPTKSIQVTAASSANVIVEPSNQSEKPSQNDDQSAPLSQKKESEPDDSRISYASDDFSSEAPSKRSEVADKLASVHLSDVSAISSAHSENSFTGGNIHSISQLESANEDEPSEKTNSYANDFSDESI